MPDTQSFIHVSATNYKYPVAIVSEIHAMIWQSGIWLWCNDNSGQVVYWQRSRGSSVTDKQFSFCCLRCRFVPYNNSLIDLLRRFVTGPQCSRFTWTRSLAVARKPYQKCPSAKIARQHMCSARCKCYCSSVCPSVCLSVRLSDGGSAKTVEVSIVECPPYYSFIPLVFAGYVSSRNSDGFPLWGASNKEGWENEPFSIYASISRKRQEIRP